MSDIRYAKSGSTAIAYQVVGDAATDLVFVPDYVSNLVYAWESPGWRSFYERLARSFRLILSDKRGTGLSDSGREFPTLETRMEDVHAVLDAVGSERAVVFGSHEGAAMATLYAATYPERTIALVLFQPSPNAGHWLDEEEAREALQRLRDNWGTQEWCDALPRDSAPSLAESQESREWFANWLRVGASPSVAYELNRAFFETDLIDVLPAVRVPTLVLHRGSVAELAALEVADTIPSAEAVRLRGEDYFPIFLSPEIADEIEAFVEHGRAPVVPDTVLATVLFTDIFRSTERARELGDRAWRDLLAKHHALVRRELARYRGAERDTAATASSRPSTGRLVRSAAPRRSSKASRMWGWRCGQACIAASASCTKERWRESPSALEHGSPHSHRPERCPCPARSKTSLRARGSRSRTAGSTSSRAWGPGASTL
jgi:pimeloyl-ACP methyl ester carboxylesterase